MTVLGDRRPSKFQPYIRTMNNDSNTCTFFKTLFLNFLPPEIRRVSGQTPKTELEGLAEKANKITEIDHTSIPIAATLVCKSSVLTGMSRLTHQEVKESDCSGYASIDVLQDPQSNFILCKCPSRFGIKARRCDRSVDGLLFQRAVILHTQRFAVGGSCLCQPRRSPWPFGRT